MNLNKCKTCGHRAERVKLDGARIVSLGDCCHANEAEGKYPPCKYTRKEECNYQPKKEN